MPPRGYAVPGKSSWAPRQVAPAVEHLIDREMCKLTAVTMLLAMAYPQCMMPLARAGTVIKYGS